MHGKFLLVSVLFFTAAFGTGHNAFLLNSQLRYQIARNKELATQIMRQHIAQIRKSNLGHYRKKKTLERAYAVLEEIEDIDPITRRQTSRRNHFNGYHTKN